MGVAQQRTALLSIKDEVSRLRLPEFEMAPPLSAFAFLNVSPSTLTSAPALTTMICMKPPPSRELPLVEAMRTTLSAGIRIAASLPPCLDVASIHFFVTEAAT